MTKLALPAGRYRLVDRASKLGALALVATGLEVGGGTLTGLALAAAGTVLGTLTVFIKQS
jgi:hypothetical protein